MAERAVQNVKELLKGRLVSVPIYRWKEIIKQIQADIRFSKNPLLNRNSPAQLVYAYKPKYRFDKWLNMARHENKESKGDISQDNTESRR